MKVHKPLISIVMPSYNQAKYLEEAINSVLSQSYPNKEFIIIDGGSNDGSVEILKKYEKHLAYWISEPDKGQSDALNKGFKRADGDLLTWVNSDDVLLPGALDAVASARNRNPDCHWFAGKCMWLDPSGRVIRCGAAEDWSSILAKLGVLHAYGPSTFFSKGMIEKAGYFKKEFHYTMDTELWLRFHYKYEYRFVRIDRYLWALRLNKSSKWASHLFDETETAVVDISDVRFKSLYNEQIKFEQRIIEETYFKGVSSLARKTGLCLSRLMRVLSLRYYRAKRDQRFWSGKHWSEIEKIL